jgi:hypothetical protein
MSDIRIYGNDHSPWVQAVMLGLHEKKIEHLRSTAPPPEVFINYGVWMPAASFDGEPWELESAHILEKLGYSAVSDEEMKSVRKAWQGVLHRADYWTRFWGEFSLASDPATSPLRRLVNNFMRSFSMLYFFVFIRFAALTGRVQEPENYGDQFVDWEEKFAAMETPFLGGSAPDSVDLLLFGIIQCHCSIPVPPVAALQSDPRLQHTRRWIGEMQKHFADYQSLYSGVYFEPHSPAPAPAAPLDQLAFWLGTIFMLCFFWITLPLVAALAYRNQKLRP